MIAGAGRKSEWEGNVWLLLLFVLKLKVVVANRLLLMLDNMLLWKIRAVMLMWLLT